jgi:uncharacterized protein (TIGR03066 family)
MPFRPPSILRPVLPVVLVTSLVLLAVACGGGSAAGGDAAPPGDPTTAILGAWESKNEVGTLSYEFTADGRFRWKSENRFQTMAAEGTYEVEDGRIALTFDDDSEGEGTFHLSFVGSDRLREDDEDIELVYERR